MRNFRTKWLVVLGLGLVCGLLFAVPGSAQINGAINNTDITGTIVDYTVNPPLSCDAVYITGGPQNKNDAGLSPTGTYYFQVTDPSGKILLSTDGTDPTTNRTLTVGTVNGKGVITGSSGSHPNGTTNSASGETTVLLWPFAPTPNSGGVYKTWISTDPTFLSGTTKTDNFKCTQPVVDCTIDPTLPECQTPPPQNADITGVKFYDANTDGIQDNGELGIANWLIQINPSDVNGATCQLTGGSGSYDFAVTPNTGFTITEGDALTPTTWLHTTATSGSATSGANGTTVNGPNFGNVCEGAGGGLTLGFWSNKNGQKLETSADMAFLDSLYLRNANGSNFDPSSTSGLSTWLLNATAVNMSYMLSAQLAAMELNVRHNDVSGSALVFAGTAPAGCTITGLQTNGFITVNDLMTAANTELGADGSATSGDPERTCQEFKKTALDNANNNLNFVQPDQNSCPAFSFNTSSCMF
jgi:hypothetical protein